MIWKNLQKCVWYIFSSNPLQPKFHMHFLCNIFLKLTLSSREDLGLGSPSTQAWFGEGERAYARNGATVHLSDFCQRVILKGGRTLLPSHPQFHITVSDLCTCHMRHRSSLETAAALNMETERLRGGDCFFSLLLDYSFALSISWVTRVLADAAFLSDVASVLFFRPSDDRDRSSFKFHARPRRCIHFELVLL